MLFASAGADWTQRRDIGQRAQEQAGCAHRLSDRRELSPAFAVRRVRLVRCNTKLRDMNVAVPAADERAIEVLASGLPLFQGAQLAVDVTVRSALTAADWWSLASKPEADGAERLPTSRVTLQE